MIVDAIAGVQGEHRRWNMSVRQEIARDVTEYVLLSTQIKKDWFAKEPTWIPWFRGHKRASWKLTPSLYRFPTPHRGLRIIEDEIRQEFIMRAPGLTNLHPQNSWEWYFLMQHSAAPTRLLDWTESALIGLYFAVRDNRGDEDAAVWALDPWWLNKRVVGKSEVVPPGSTIGLSKKDGQRYDPWLPDRYASEKKLSKALPVAIYPNHTAPRISTQRSCFTIHGSQWDGLDAISEEKNARLIKIVVPGPSVRVVKEQLMVSGIDEVTIFPDTDGLGRSLMTMLKTETGFGSVSFEKVIAPKGVPDLIEFDKKIFHAYPSDIFTKKEWLEFESYWMVVDGKKIGCSGFKANFDYDDSRRPGCLFIATTGILQEMQGHGLGRMQKKWQIDYARQNGFKMIATNMRQSNHPIIGLNNELGFQIRKVDKTYYSKPQEAAIVMDLNLTAPAAKVKKKT
jgi:GNAT superfamily N-acetyltransferase